MVTLIRWSLTICVFLSAPAAAVRAAGDAEVNYARGLIAFDQGSWGAAYDYFDRAVQADPEHAPARYYRGLTEARRGAREAAIDDLGAAIEIDPSLRRVALDLGIAYFDDDNYEEAESWLESAYNADTDRRTAALFLGLTKYRLGEYADAVRYLGEANGDAEMRPVAHYYTALALAKLRRASEARLELASAASSAPNSEIGRTASRYVTGRDNALVAAEPWSVFAETQLGYDSNVVIGTADGTGDTAEDGDGAWVLGVGGEYRFIDSATGILRGSAALSQSVHFDRSDFDLTATRLRLEWLSAIDWFEYGLSGGYDFYGLNYQTFSQDVVTTPWVAARAASFAATQLFYGFRYRDFFRSPYSPYRDGWNNSVGARQHFLLPDGVSVAHFGYRFDAEEPEHVGDDKFRTDRGAQDFEYDGHEFSVGGGSALELQSLGAFNAEAEYVFRYEDYAHRNSRTRSFQQNGTITNGLHRHDAEHEFAVSVARDLTPEADFLRAWTDSSEVTLTFIGIVNDSNVSQFEYDRFLTMLGFRARF
jgi:tetratricopeptide (TPR) repeat protein